MNERMSREEPGAWKLGIFYLKQEDPALWVPKRFSPGMTINLGYPKGRLLMAGVGVLLASSS